MFFSCFVFGNCSCFIFFSLSNLSSFSSFSSLSIIFNFVCCSFCVCNFSCLFGFLFKSCYLLLMLGFCFIFGSLCSRCDGFFLVCFSCFKHSVSLLLMLFFHSRCLSFCCFLFIFSSSIRFSLSLLEFFFSSCFGGLSLCFGLF